MANMTIKPFNPKTKNIDVINAIRHDASLEYQSRVPRATQATLTQTMENIVNYQPVFNEFVDAIINKVGLTIVRNKSWSNPLAKFKRGMLEFGDTIEEIQTGLVKAYVYDHDRDYGEKAIFGREYPEVQADYHKINRENFYKITVDRVALKRAFLSPTGLADFINDLMTSSVTSDNLDEYLSMRQLFPLYESNGGFFKIHVDPVTGADSTEAAQNALMTMREYADTLPFVSRRYNAAGMPTHASADDLELFVSPKFKAALDVKGLAALFNVSYGEVPYRTTVIDDFGIDGVQAILTTRDFFVVADTYFETTSANNPVGIHDNYFLHHHQIVSASRFVPAIAFTTGEGTEVTEPDTPVSGISEVTVTEAGVEVTSVERGFSYEVHAEATTDGPNDAVTFTLSGNESPKTRIKNTGVLSVFVGEDSDTLTITAETVDPVSGEKFTSTIDLSVVGDKVTFWPNPSVETDSDNDGIPEVTPIEPSRSGNTIVIPTVTGVQYSVAGTPATNGSSHEIAASTTVTAEARSGYELADGVTASWTYEVE